VTGGRPTPGARTFLVAGLAALLLPGLGHAVLGERRRAGGFFCVVTMAFAAGIGLGGRLPWPRADAPTTLVGTAATASNVLLFSLTRLAGRGSGDPGSSTYEFGNGFLLTAGTMNLLLVTDLVARAAREPR
jgi:hypothetical protein